MIVVGISGRAGHGKDTLSRILSGQLVFKDQTETRHFAEPIKRIAQLVFGFSREDMNTEEGKKKPGAYGFTIREILQKIGTEMFRDLINPNIWVDYMDRKVKESEKSLIFVPDLRFANEEAWIKSVGGLIIKVSREDHEAVSNVHASESYIDLIQEDVLVENTGSLPEFVQKVREEVFPELCDWLATEGFFTP